MDFSIFEKRKKTVPTHCELIVVDFVNKKEVYRAKVDNLKPVPQEIQNKLEAARQIVAEAIKSNEKQKIQNTAEESLKEVKKA